MKSDDRIIGEGYMIQPVNIRGWDCHIYTSFDPPFVTGRAEDDDSIQVLVDFDAEFGFDWRGSDIQQLFKRAERIACVQLGERIEQTTRERRKRWRARKR